MSENCRRTADEQAGGVSFRDTAASRLIPHAFVFAVVWPVMSVLFGAVEIAEQSVAKNASWELVLLGCFSAAGFLLPEFIALAAILTATTVILFSLVDGALCTTTGGAFTRRYAAMEPVLFSLAFTCGVSIEHPSLLRHPAFMMLRQMTVRHALPAAITVILTAALLYGHVRGNRRGAAAAALIVAIALAAGWAITSLPILTAGPATVANSIVLLGLDSLSQSDDVLRLKEFTTRHAGTWYSNAVTPALVTNAVWGSILMHRPPSESGVLLVYQEVDWSRVPFNLVAEANRRRYKTYSFFSSQFTSYVGSKAGFQVDRSSPVGWLYPATGFVKNASVFMPILLPRLPPIPFSGAPRNQEGTFAYDLRAAVREILTATDGKHPSFVAAHLDYLHAHGFPRNRELGSDVRTVLDARVGMLEDQSLDPESPTTDAPFPLREWKIQHLQRVVAEELEASDFFRRGNRLVIFSDHGLRSGFSATNFGKRSYTHVLLATFGVPARPMSAPVSLIDIAQMISMPAPGKTRPHAPVVQHAAVSPQEAIAIQKSIRERRCGGGLRSDGTVGLDWEIVRQIARRLVTFVPFGQDAGYWRTPAELPVWVSDSLGPCDPPVAPRN